MKKQVMKEVTISICDYCGKEVKDNNWSGSSGEDFHDMRHGGEFSDGKKTCYEKHREKLRNDVSGGLDE